MAGEIDVLLDQIAHSDLLVTERQRLADLLPKLQIVGPWHTPTKDADFMCRDLLGTDRRALAVGRDNRGYHLIVDERMVPSEFWPLTDEGLAAARLIGDRQLYRGGYAFAGDSLLWQIARRCVELGEHVGFAAHMYCRTHPEKSIGEIGFSLKRDPRMRLLLRKWRHQRDREEELAVQEKMLAPFEVPPAPELEP